jgi:hypothetical protein
MHRLHYFSRTTEIRDDLRGLGVGGDNTNVTIRKIVRGLEMEQLRFVVNTLTKR